MVESMSGPSPEPAESGPGLGAFVVDTLTGKERLGRVVADDDGCLCLRPPGGGKEWTAVAGDLRPPTEAEWVRIRMLTTPVPGAQP